MNLSPGQRTADGKENRGGGDEAGYDGYYHYDTFHAEIPAGWGTEIETGEMVECSVPFENTKWNYPSRETRITCLCIMAFKLVVDEEDLLIFLLHRTRSGADRIRWHL